MAQSGRALRKRRALRTLSFPFVYTLETIVDVTLTKMNRKFFSNRLRLRLWVNLWVISGEQGKPAGINVAVSH